jgi:hypothetical protein
LELQPLQPALNPISLAFQAFFLPLLLFPTSLRQRATRTDTHKRAC